MGRFHLLGSALLILGTAALSSAAGFVRGVNYGNKFVPEPWMTHCSESVWGTKYSNTSQPCPSKEIYRASDFIETLLLG